MDKYKLTPKDIATRINSEGILDVLYNIEPEELDGPADFISKYTEATKAYHAIEEFQDLLYNLLGDAQEDLEYTDDIINKDGIIDSDAFGFMFDPDNDDRGM